MSWRQRRPEPSPDDPVRHCSMCRGAMTIIKLSALPVVESSDGVTAGEPDFARSIWACEKCDLQGGPVGPEGPVTP